MNLTSAGYEIITISISKLVPHEKIIEEHLSELYNQIKNDGYLLRPIAVSKLDQYGEKWKCKFLILDGHHRTESLKKLGCKFIKAVVVDFNEPRIRVFNYKNLNIEIPKEKIIELGLNGGNLPQRLSKHMIEFNGTLMPFQDNDYIEPAEQTPLEELM